jgi:hypothetical protein
MVDRYDLFFKANACGHTYCAKLVNGKKVKLTGCKTFDDYFIPDYWLDMVNRPKPIYYHEVEKLIDVQC